MALLNRPGRRSDTGCADEAAGPYEIAVLKREMKCVFLYQCAGAVPVQDDGETYGKLLEGGKDRFPPAGSHDWEYENLEVWTVTKKVKGKKAKTS